MEIHTVYTLQYITLKVWALGSLDYFAFDIFNKTNQLTYHRLHGKKTAPLSVLFSLVSTWVGYTAIKSSEDASHGVHTL
jgi:hypothetical protein